MTDHEERLLVEVTLSGAPLNAYRGGLPLSSCMESPEVRYRVLPARPVNEVLAEAAIAADFCRDQWSQKRVDEDRKREEMQHWEDVIAQLRALAAGPTGEDWEQAVHAADIFRAIQKAGGEHTQTTVSACHNILAQVIDRVSELARERSEKP